MRRPASGVDWFKPIQAPTRPDIGFSIKAFPGTVLVGLVRTFSCLDSVTDDTRAALSQLITLLYPGEVIMPEVRQELTLQLSGYAPEFSDLFPTPFDDSDNYSDDYLDEYDYYAES